MENLKQVDKYLSDDNEDHDTMVELIRLGINFMVYKPEDELHFAPSRFVGYLKNSLEVHLVEGNGKDGKNNTCY